MTLMQQFYKQFSKQCSFLQFKPNCLLWNKKVLLQRIWFGNFNLGKYSSFQKNKLVIHCLSLLMMHICICFLSMRFVPFLWTYVNPFPALTAQECLFVHKQELTFLHIQSSHCYMGVKKLFQKLKSVWHLYWFRPENGRHSTSFLIRTYNRPRTKKLAGPNVLKNMSKGPTVPKVDNHRARSSITIN